MEKTSIFKGETRFLTLIALFIASIFVFHDQPQIAMWVGFALAGYSAIANDSIQTLGTFLSSNRKQKWWVLWLFIGGIMLATLLYGWHLNLGDPAYGRLTKIPEPQEFNYLQLLAPVALLILTQFKVPVSTTFLLLSVFSSSKTISAMLTKTFIGYFVAFLAAIFLWMLIGKMKEKKFLFSKTYNKKLWRVLQWAGTAYLWIAWLMQDLANVTVYLPRTLTMQQISIVSISLFLLMGVLLYLRGGKIQSIITEKTDVVDVRSATVIDIFYATVLLIFKEWNNLPMSTTWVFLGLLAGREVALAYFTTHEKKYIRTLGLVMKDLALACIGLIVSLLLAWGANANFNIVDLLG